MFKEHSKLSEQKKLTNNFANLIVSYFIVFYILSSKKLKTKFWHKNKYFFENIVLYILLPQVLYFKEVFVDLKSDDYAF